MTRQPHFLGLIPITLAKMLERLGYYVFISLFVVYIVSQFEFNKDDAYSFYGTITWIILFMPVLGGIIGDFLTGAKLAMIIGGYLQGIGYFIVAIENKTCLYAGLVLIIAGLTLNNANSISLLGSLYNSRPQKSDVAMLLLFGVPVFGSLIAHFLLPAFIDNHAYQIGFCFAGAAAIIASTILIVFNSRLTEVRLGPNIYRKDKINTTDIATRIVFIAVLVLFIPAFGNIYSSVEPFHLALYLRLNVVDSIPFYGMIPMVTIMIAGTIFAVVMSLFNISTLLKISAGFGLLALMILFEFFLCHRSNPDRFFVFVGFNIFLISLVEMIIIPAAWSLLSKHAPVKFHATTIGAFLTIVNLIPYYGTWFMPRLDNKLSPLIFILYIIVCVVIAAVFLVFHFFLKEKFVEVEKKEEPEVELGVDAF